MKSWSIDPSLKLVLLKNTVVSLLSKEIEDLTHKDNLGSSRESSSGGFIKKNDNLGLGFLVSLPCDKGCPTDSHCNGDLCQCNEGFVGNPVKGCEGIRKKNDKT